MNWSPVPAAACPSSFWYGLPALPPKYSGILVVATQNDGCVALR